MNNNSKNHSICYWVIYFMKKIIIVLFLISGAYLISNKDEIIIPNNAIRFRIIASSNSIEDQLLKNSIKDDLINNVFPNINNENDIYDSIPKMDEIIKKYNVDYKLNYGYNYFPKKEYKGIKYPSGKYKSLVITMEEGLGDNFWCVLYPPLCFIEENESYNSIEYKSLFKEVLDNYNKKC